MPHVFLSPHLFLSVQQNVEKKIESNENSHKIREANRSKSEQRKKKTRDAREIFLITFIYTYILHIKQNTAAGIYIS